MSAPITFGGLASGMDTNSIITQLVNIQKQPMVDLQNQVLAAQSRQSILADLGTKLSTMQTAVSSLNTQLGVQGRSINVDSGATFSATAAGNAPLGNYGVVVSGLAQAQRTYSNAYADPGKTGLLNAGTLTLSVAGKHADIGVTANDSLNTVAGAINSAGLGLSASVVYDGKQYRMVIDGNASGASNAITFGDTGTGLGLDVQKNTKVAAQDAQLTVDGIAVTSATNTVTGIIPGVTMNLTGTSATSYNLTIADDPTKLQTALQTMVTAYNAVMGEVKQQMPKAGATSQPGAGSLSGDSAALQLQSTLLSMPTVSGGPLANTFATLAEIGVTTDRYGTMSLDTGKLQTALSTDRTAVTNLLVGTDGKNGLATKLGNLIGLYTDPVNGVLTSDSQGIGQEITDMNHSIDRMSSMADTYQASLQAQFSAMEQIVSIYQHQTSALSGLTASLNSSYR